MKKVYIVFISSMFSTCMSAQTVWTLKDCIDYAMQNSITLKKAELSHKNAEEELKSSRAAMLPSLSGSTSQTVGYRPWQNTFTVSNGTMGNKVSKSYYNGSYGINTSWTVWNGGQNTNQVKAKRVAEEKADVQIQVSANSIQEQIAQLYVKALYLNEAITVNQESLEASKKNEERGRQMVEVGKMSKADLAQLTAARATDEYNIVEARAALAECKLQLKQLLEITGEQPFDIDAAPADDAHALTDIPLLNSVYELALTSRPEIKNAELAVSASDLQIKIARGGFMPTVNLTGGVGTSTSSGNSNEWGKQMKSNFDASAGVSVSIPIYDQRKARTAVRTARIQRDMAQLELKETQKELYKTIEGYWQNAHTNQQKFRAAMASEESEQQSYDLLSEQFRLGLKNIVELLTGKVNLLKARQNKLESKYNTILNRQMLLFYEGETINI